MTKTAYLTGYTGKPTRTPQQLLQLAINLGAVVVDSRYSPRSRVPHWNMPAMAALMGQKYIHIRDLGNQAYKDSYIKLVDPASGLDQLSNHTSDTFIILCACTDGATCHRKQVGEYLAAHGWEVREVTSQEWEEARQ